MRIILRYFRELLSRIFKVEYTIVDLIMLFTLIIGVPASIAISTTLYQFIRSDGSYERVCLEEITVKEISGIVYRSSSHTARVLATNGGIYHTSHTPLEIGSQVCLNSEYRLIDNE